MTDDVDVTDDGLTDRQRRFVDAYMGDAKCVGVSAARMAGYAGDYNALCSTASTLLRNPKVRGALNVRMENDPLIMGRTERLRELSRIARREITATKVDPDTGEAIEVPIIVPIKDAIAAMKDLAQAQGDHVTKVELTGKDGAPIESKVSVLTPASAAEIKAKVLFGNKGKA